MKQAWNQCHFKSRQSVHVLLIFNISFNRSLSSAIPLACVASVPVQRERNSDLAKDFSHLGRAKNGARAKTWKEGGGEGERRRY